MQGFHTDPEMLHWCISPLCEIAKGWFPELHAWEITVWIFCRLQRDRLKVQKNAKVNDFWYFQDMICRYFWFQKWLQPGWNHERCGWGFGVSQLHVFAVRSWLGFPQTHKTDGGRQRDYKQKLLHARSQQESVAQKNLEFTLQYLHHVETHSRGEAGPSTQNELRSRNTSSSSSRGSKKNNTIPNCNHAV